MTFSAANSIRLGGHSHIEELRRYISTQLADLGKRPVLPVLRTETTIESKPRH
jgi:hypothetical protein